MKVISDAGPLMAFAKVGGLDVLFQLFPRILTPPAVYEELITAGLRLEAPDALLLATHYRSAQIEVRSFPVQSPEPEVTLGAGEEQSIRLAIGERADWLLVDDAEARRTALSRLEKAGLETKVTGTLGVIVLARREGRISHHKALDLLEALSARPDIWISADLLRRVREILAEIGGPAGPG